MTNSLKRVTAAMILLAAGLSMADEKATIEEAARDTGERMPLHTVVPMYPEKARMARVEGEVEVCFNVDRNGMTRRVAVRRSTNKVFEKPSRDAIRASTYRPLPFDQTLSGIKSCRTFRFFLILVEIETPEN